MKKIKFKAFTLIETILYLGLFNVMFITVITFTIAISNSNKTSEYRNAIEKNSIFISEHISESIHRSNSVDETNSTFDESNGKVRVINGTVISEYYIDNGTLMLNNGSSVIALSDPLVRITKFTVNKVFDNKNNLIGLRISITIAATKFYNEVKSISGYYAFR